MGSTIFGDVDLAAGERTAPHNEETDRGAVGREWIGGRI
jgi:hypothetical protein